MWAPVLNNLVVIGSGHRLRTSSPTRRPAPGHLTHAADARPRRSARPPASSLQTIALLPSLRRVGFRLKPRWDWRGAGLRRAGPFAGWVLGYVITNQLGYLVISELAEAVDDGKGELRHLLLRLHLLFSLPYAVVAVTVITALFPGMSRSATEGDEAGGRAARCRKGCRSPAWCSCRRRCCS